MTKTATKRWPAKESFPGTATSTENPTIKLRLLATSDVHAHIMAWDYHADRPSDARGLARVASLIAQARLETGNSLLLDNGDFLNGSPLGDFVAETGTMGAIHPMIAAMNRLGYDAATLGNHEFSCGLPFLHDALAQAGFPFVSANLWHRPDPQSPDWQTLVPPFVVLTRTLTDSAGRPQTLRIGVIGFLPPPTLIWEQRHLGQGFHTADIVTTARKAVPELRARGADLVIALSHSGFGPAVCAENSENASLALAAVDGIDAIIAGHSHQVFPKTGLASDDLVQGLNGKPAVMPGLFGSHLGVIDLTVQRGPAGWQVVASHAETRPTARRDPQTGSLTALVPSDPEIEAIARPSHAAVCVRSTAIIGHSAGALHSYFALISATPAMRVVAEAQAAHVRAALAGGADAGLPVLSAAAPYRAGGRGGPENYTDIPAGPLNNRHLCDLYMHPNSVVALKLTGAELALWLERSVSLFHRVAPGARDAALIDADFPSFNFDMILGLTYRIDLSIPPRFDARGAEIDPQSHRIVDLCHQGTPIDPAQIFVLATNSYRSGGGSGFAGTTPDRVIYESGVSTRDLLKAHIAGRGVIDPGEGPDWWRFLPQPGTTACFESAPRAAERLADVSNLHVEAGALQPNGFRRFHLHL